MAHEDVCEADGRTTDHRLLYPDRVSTQTDQPDPTDSAPPAPTPEQIAQGVAALLDEVGEAFASDRWAILDTGREHSTWLLYDGAALRHCCNLMYEIEVAALADLELSVRMLGRAHLEAWLMALYIHFGGYEALVKVGQDARHALEGIAKEGREFDEWLAAEKRAARKSTEKVAKANSGISQWNEANPNAPAKPLLDEPYVPQLGSTGLDLDDLIGGFDPHEAQGLPVKNIVEALTRMGPDKGFARESFRPMYLIYRTLSTIGFHANVHILDAYFVPGGFIRIAPAPINGSVIDSIRVTALYGTAYLAGYVLGSNGIAAPAADEIRDWLRPDPSGRAAWAPGV